MHAYGISLLHHYELFINPSFLRLAFGVENTITLHIKSDDKNIGFFCLLLGPEWEIQNTSEICSSFMCLLLSSTQSPAYCCPFMSIQRLAHECSKQHRNQKVGKMQMEKQHVVCSYNGKSISNKNE